MPFLSYSSITDYPFQPFTKIYSSDINAMFATLTTLLNITLLDFQNVQALGLKRYGASGNLQAGTPNFVVFNDNSGYLEEAAYLPPALGGLGANLAPSGPSQAGQPVVVNSSGTGFALGVSAVNNVFNYRNFT